ncbi:MAG: hypothetical protein ACU0B9_18625 [Limimaricola soesokkakensis]|uniref:hypothetical protein n=1 Tax=Limimaricola soesokkakensis TaxID=1343159 RepID=UPI0040590E9E
MGFGKPPHLLPSLTDFRVEKLEEGTVPEEEHPEPLADLHVVLARLPPALAGRFVRHFFAEVVPVTFNLFRDIEVEILLEQQGPDV